MSGATSCSLSAGGGGRHGRPSGWEFQVRIRTALSGALAEETTLTSAVCCSVYQGPINSFNIKKMQLLFSPLNSCYAEKHLTI